MEARTRKIAILVENGFNHDEVTQVMAALQSSGVHMEIVSKYGGMLSGADGQQLEVNKNYVSTGSVMYDALYVPGGRQSVDTLLGQGEALHFVNETFKHAKAIAASNEGVELLEGSQIQGVAMAGPETKAQLFMELGVITIRNSTDMGPFSQEFISAIARHRHWARQIQKKIVPA